MFRSSTTWCVVAGLVLAAVALAGCGGNSGVDPSLSPDGQAGLELARALACVSCHGENGEGVEGLGPPIAGLLGSEATLIDGRIVVIDVDYLRTALLNPDANLRVDWHVPMPAYELSPDELRAMLAYLAEAG